MKFLCLGYRDERKFDALPKAEVDAIVGKCRTYDAALRESGRLQSVGSLAPPAEAITIRPQGGRLVSTTNPGFPGTRFDDCRDVQRQRADFQE